MPRHSPSDLEKARIQDLRLGSLKSVGDTRSSYQNQQEGLQNQLDSLLVPITCMQTHPNCALTQQYDRGEKTARTPPHY